MAANESTTATSTI